MSRLSIPIQFFDALKKCPPIYRLMWVEWLSSPDNLFNPKFSENLRYDNVYLPHHRHRKFRAQSMHLDMRRWSD